MTPILFFLVLEKMTFAAGYIPNIQFAPFYIAMEKGFYREEGIDLEIDYTMGPDILKLVALGKIHVGSSDPDAFLNAVEHRLPLVHVATLYQSYPITLISKEKIEGPENLRGKRIGISGTYGSSYLGFKALLGQLGLELKDIDLRAIGYTQVATLKTGRVDAVIGYTNHEPVLLQHSGMKVHTLNLNRQSQWPGVGLMTGRDFAKEKPDLLQGFLRATFRGVDYVLQQPEESFKIVTQSYLPQINNDQRRATEKEVLMRTLPFLKSAYSDDHGLGQCDPKRWENLVNIMIQENLLPAAVDWRQGVDRTFSLQQEKTIPMNRVE